MACGTFAGTHLTISQAVDMAKKAGFTDTNSLITFIATLEGESSLWTQAINHCDPNGGSFGICQINGIHFGSTFQTPSGTAVMSESVAFDPQMAMYFAWGLSNHGTNFNPWGAYQNGSYGQYINAVRQVVTGGSSGSSDIPADMRWILGVNLYAPGIRYRQITPDGGGCAHDCEGGVDIPEPGGTPIYALAAGELVGEGIFFHDKAHTRPGYGVVTERVPGIGNVYYQHLDLNPALPTDYSGQPSGYMIHKGDLLGWTRSNVGEVEVGVNPGWGGIWGGNPPGPWLGDPRATLIALAQGGGGTGGTGGTSPGTGGTGIGSQTSPNPLLETLGQKIHNTLVQYPGMYGIADALDLGETFPGFLNEIPSGDWFAIPGGVLQSVADTVVQNSIPFFIRGTLIVLGLFLLIALLWQLAKPNLEALPDLIKLGMLAA